MKRVGLAIVFALLFVGSLALGAEDRQLPEALRPQAQAAQEAFAKGRYREAAGIYETMRVAAPKNLFVLSNLATVQFRLGQFQNAAESLREALAVAPNDGYCRRMLGIVFYSESKFAQAESELRKAVEIDPKDAEAHLYLAFCAGQMGEQEKEAKEMATARSLNPDYEADPAKRARPTGASEAGPRWPVGDYLTPLERSRLRLPPQPVIR